MSKNVIDEQDLGNVYRQKPVHINHNMSPSPDL